MKPINKNIVIRSVIGRYLEHSRIYYFYNNEKSEVFISSADMLTRNLDKRIELLILLTDSQVKSKLLSILSHYFKDTVNTYIMNEKGNYELLEKDYKFNIHEYFISEAINNFKLRSIPKISLKVNKK
jgi:polyphosphate kinase